jgi:hypothetical protein
MARHFLPRDALPGHLQGHTLCFGTLPLTHGFTFQHTGPTSAYPGDYSRLLLLRASCAPAASGGRLLCRGTCSTEGCWRSSRTQARATLGREFPISALSIAERVPSPAIVHVSCVLSKIPYGGFSPVRLQTEAPFGQPYPSRSPHGLKPQVDMPPEIIGLIRPSSASCPLASTVGIINATSLGRSARPPQSTGPLLRQSCVVSALHAPTTRSASLDDSRRLPRLPGYTTGLCPTTWSGLSPRPSLL